MECIWLRLLSTSPPSSDFLLIRWRRGRRPDMACGPIPTRLCSAGQRPTARNFTRNAWSSLSGWPVTGAFSAHFAGRVLRVFAAPSAQHARRRRESCGTAPKNTVSVSLRVFLKSIYLRSCGSIFLSKP